MPLPDIVFLDLEASGLGSSSWPVEVGWCFLSGRPVSLLITPHEDWRDEAWDPEAERLHGLSRKKLERKGEDAGAVCDRMNAALEGRLVYSDAPDWDGFWLYRLFSAGKRRQAFKLRDFAELFAATPSDDFLQAKERAQKIAPHRHRAKDDVLHMRKLFELAGAAPDG